MIVEAPDRDFTRKIIDHYVEHLVLNPWSGRELYKLLQQVGLENVVVADTVTVVLTDFSTANHLFGIEKAADLIREEKPSFAASLNIIINTKNPQKGIDPIVKGRFILDSTSGWNISNPRAINKENGGNTCPPILRSTKNMIISVSILAKRLKGDITTRSRI